MNPIDRLGRPLRSLRISVTDRCNLRCQYCMPEEEYVWLRRDQLLSFEEIGQVAGVFAGLGVEKFRLTGGEPLVRRDLAELVKLLARDPRIRDLALTTNGMLLSEHASALKRAGLHRVTVSLDTLRPERFRDLAKRDALRQVLAGIDAALSAGFHALKLDSVVIRGVNDDELIDLLELWMSAELRSGHGSESFREPQCSRVWRRTTGRSERSRSAARTPRSASNCPTDIALGSSLRPPRLFAAHATEVVSPRTACGFSAFTQSPGLTCGACCGGVPRGPSSNQRSARRGAYEQTGARRSAWRSKSGDRSPPPRPCAKIRT